MLRSFPHYQQLDSMDCGPSCLRMIAKFYGRVYSIQNLREKAFITREGVSIRSAQALTKHHIPEWPEMP